MYSFSFRSTQVPFSKVMKMFGNLNLRWDLERPFRHRQLGYCNGLKSRCFILAATYSHILAPSAVSGNLDVSKGNSQKPAHLNKGLSKATRNSKLNTSELLTPPWNLCVWIGTASEILHPLLSRTTSPPKSTEWNLEINYPCWMPLPLG